MKTKKLLKRIISLLVTMGVMFMITTISVSAVNNEGISVTQIPEFEVQDMLEKGRSLIKQKAYKELIIDKYYQNRFGDPWINDIMQSEGLTIKSSGCTLTSFTMLHNYYSGTNDNPGTVNSKLGWAACPFNYNTASQKFGYADKVVATSCNSYSDCTALIATNIEKNIPIIVQMKNPKGGYHYVLAKGYGGTAVMINDPDIYKDYYELGQYENDGYIMDKIYIFKRK